MCSHTSCVSMYLGDITLTYIIGALPKPQCAESYPELTLNPKPFLILSFIICHFMLYRDSHSVLMKETGPRATKETDLCSHKASNTHPQQHTHPHTHSIVQLPCQMLLIKWRSQTYSQFILNSNISINILCYFCPFVFLLVTDFHECFFFSSSSFVASKNAWRCHVFVSMLT